MFKLDLVNENHSHGQEKFYQGIGGRLIIYNDHKHDPRHLLILIPSSHEYPVPGSSVLTKPTSHSMNEVLSKNLNAS